MKSFLIIMQQNPYANSLALEALEFAVALSAFNQPVALLLKDAGIIQLLAQQEADKLVAKDFTKIYSGLNLFGIKNVYVEQSSFKQYANVKLLVQPIVLDADGIINLIKKYDVVMTV